MDYKPQVGRPHELTEEKYKEIIKNVRVALKINTTAMLSMVAPSTLKLWLKDGKRDYAEKKCTISARLWLNFTRVQAEKIVEWLKKIQKTPKQWQALWVLTQAVAREDFGVDSVEHKDLLDKFTKLSDDFRRLSENQGGINNGSEMDS